MIREYLTQLLELRKEGRKIPKGYAYWGMDDYVLTHGAAFSVQDLTPEEHKIVVAAKKNKSFFPKHCFSNAQRLVLGDKTFSLVYVEGYAHNYIPVHHGWAVLNGKVIDVTWKDATRYLPEYFGVTFPDRKLLRVTKRKARSVSLLDNYEEKYPLFRDPPNLP